MAAQGEEAEAVDYSCWPIKELKRFLTERGADPTGIVVEKDDLVAKVRNGPLETYLSAHVQVCFCQLHFILTSPTYVYCRRPSFMSSRRVALPLR